MEQIKLTDRNFNTISPSAKWIILMKGHTDIPFAYQTAELIEYPNKYIPNFDSQDYSFWARTLHFEYRYFSINQLLDELPIKNILELSSGFSFRGLEKIKSNSIHYIDTDLPEMITQKKLFLTVLKNEKMNTEGKLELLPLNALDNKQFKDIIDQFPSGEIAIVNEGLLMYLNKQEKEKLCCIIHEILKERGGYWITADIYLKNKQNKLDLKVDDKTQEFFELHNIEDNKFESFNEAEEFFKKMGFIVEMEANIEPSQLSSFKYFKKSIVLNQLLKFQKVGKIQSTWRLRISEN